MTSRDRIVVIVVLAAVVLGGFWFMILSPKRKTSADLDKQIAVVEQRLSAAQTSAQQAQDAKAHYKSDYAAVAKLGQAVPASDDVPSLIYQIDHAAKAATIDFRSLKASTAAATPVPPAATPAPTAAAGAAGATPAAATIDPATLPTLPFAFIFTGSFFHLESFLHNLDGFTRLNTASVDVHGRLLAIKGFTLGPGAGGFPHMTASVDAVAYTLPADQGLTAGATPLGPAAAPQLAGAAPASTPAAPTTAATAALTTGGSR